MGVGREEFDGRIGLEVKYIAGMKKKFTSSLNRPGLTKRLSTVNGLPLVWPKTIRPVKSLTEAWNLLC
jgi:hypothetical protein